MKTYLSRQTTRQTKPTPSSEWWAAPAAARAAGMDKRFKARWDRDYWGELAKQDGHCEMCLTKPNGKRLCADHWHGCPYCGGAVGCPQCYRGLLCDSCNQFEWSITVAGPARFRAFYERDIRNRARMAREANGDGEYEPV